MTTRNVRAALVACLLSSAAILSVAASVSSAYAKSAAGPSVSAPVGKLLQPAQPLAETDPAAALALVKQAQALPDQTPVDTFRINEFLGQIYLKMNDHVNAETAFEGMADSPILSQFTPEEQNNALRISALLATEQRHFDKGIKYGKAFNALGGPLDKTVQVSMAQAYYNLNDFPNSIATAQKIIDATPAGQAPDHDALEIILSSQLSAKQIDAGQATLEKIVGYYDDPEEWDQVIELSMNTPGIKDVEVLHIYRLIGVTKAKAHPDDYTVPAAVALTASTPVESQALLEAGIAAGVLDNGGKTGQLLADARARAAKDRATVAGFDAAARKSPNGELDLKLAETYYGYGRYADAEEAARRALTKGGAKANPAEAGMVLGEALLMQGKTADAVAAFNAIRNPSPGFARAQRLWLLYINSKNTAAAAPPPPAH